MNRLKRLRAHLTQRLAFEVRPDFQFIRSAIRHDLRGRLAVEDSEDKKAVVMTGSVWLARWLGLARTKLLILDYPDFTLENLALLSDEYDFVIADRALHRCDDLRDAAHETMRVLRLGGCFVHTTSCLDFALDVPADGRRLTPRALAPLFPQACALETGGGPMAGWIIGRKAKGVPVLLPTMETRTTKRPWYRFAPRPAKFGIMAIVRNEAPYLLQWIAHYRVLGFEQITIYDNESNDGTPRILAPLARAGIINAVFWKDCEDRQRRAYNNALRRLRSRVEWCLFADLDEFLVLDPGLTLDDLLPSDPGISAIGIPWRIFGSAGQRNRGTELVIERFTKAAPTFHRLVKSLVRLRDARRIGIHVPKQIDGRVTDLQGLPLDLHNPRTAPSAARINHYFNRSWEEFVYKRLRRDVASLNETYSFNAFDRYGAGEVELRDALPLAPAVKEEMARLRRIVGRLTENDDLQSA
ncbi:glycosyltransferase family 2 protein [Dongia deserti]|uniref:glycosyltransferase family 2 protein n=1 Tax=Dongia deserti TaxID=2268030 RepID=UPI000E64957A|nr:glycosyltransferase family 2 protein [Dongia deserti]